MVFIPDIESTAESKVELKLNLPAVLREQFLAVEPEVGFNFSS